MEATVTSNPTPMPPDGVTPASRRTVKLPARPVRILVADDEPLVTAGLCDAIRALGFAVVGPASDGDQALELCGVERPDLAVLNIRMPLNDSLASAMISFRQLGIPTMIITALAQPEYVETANRHGAFGYLLKPVSNDQLRAAIDIAWGRFLDHTAHCDEIQMLKQRLEDRKIIEQAKWLIVSGKSLSEPDAMKLLQRHARNTRRTLPDVARAVIESQEFLQSL